MFKGFKPQAVEKIANKMGYQGSMQNFDNYLQQNPDNLYHLHQLYNFL